MDDGQYGLLSGISTIAESLSTAAEPILGSTGWSLSDTEARDAVEALWRARATLEALYLHTVRVLDQRPDALDGAGKGRVAATFLVGRLHVDGPSAAADVKAAHALDPDSGDLVRLGEALAAGRVSRAHVDVAVAAVAALPKTVLNQQLPVDDTPAADDETSDREGADADAEARTTSGAEFVDGWLAEHACRVQPRTLKAMARGLRDRLDPDHDDRSFDPDAHLKRSVSLHRDRTTGMATLRATLMAADAAAVAAFLRSASKPAPPVETLRDEPDGSTQVVEVRDQRGVDARRYDALFGLLRSAFAGRFPAAAAAAQTASGPDDTDGTSAGADTASPGTEGAIPAADGAGVPVRLLVTATLDQVAAAAALAGGARVPATFAAAGRGHLDRVGDLDPDLLAYLSCTAAVQRLLLSPSGQVLDLGRTVRFASVAQRRAAAVRDGGCVIPGCPCPAEDVDLHHRVHWGAGGPTDLDNLVSLCVRHHQETHAGVWAVEVRDGVVWVRPPAWIDPLQRWLRAPQRDCHDAVRRAAEQLRLDLDDAA